MAEDQYMTADEIRAYGVRLSNEAKNVRFNVLDAIKHQIAITLHGLARTIDYGLSQPSFTNGHVDRAAQACLEDKGLKCEWKKQGFPDPYFPDLVTTTFEKNLCTEIAKGQQTAPAAEGVEVTEDETGRTWAESVRKGQGRVRE